MNKPIYLVLCLPALVFSLNSFAEQNTAKSFTPQTSELNRPLDNSQIENIRIIARKVLADKKTEATTTVEGAQTSAELQEVRLQIQAYQKNRQEAKPIKLSSKNAAEDRATEEVKELKSLRDVSRKMKLEHLKKNDSAELQQGIDDDHIRIKRSKIQTELDEALASPPLERNLKLQALSEQLAVHRASDVNDHVQLQPTISTITEHRHE